jgi:hypothetical protein
VRRALLLVVFGGTVACGSKEPPAKEPDPASSSKPAASGWILRDDQCSGDDCYAIGIQLSDQEKPEAARRAFERGCSGAQPSAKACSALALMLANGEGGPKDENRALALAEKSCAADDPGGCLMHGLIMRNRKDSAVAANDFDKACRLGLKAACKEKGTVAPPADSSTAFTADEMTLEGLSIAKLECKLEGGASGLLGALVVGKTLSARKAEMTKCTKKPADVKVSWTSSPGSQTATDIVVDSPDAKLKACVEKALDGAPATVPGKCSATVRLKP